MGETKRPRGRLCMADAPQGLRRLSKADVLDQLAKIRRMAGGGTDDWKVFIPRNLPKPRTDLVLDVETEGDTAFIRPVTAEERSLREVVARLSCGKCGVMSMADVEKAFAESPADKVLIGWPQGRKSCVCRILAVSGDAGGYALLFPGPADMEKVNEEILEYRKTHGCPTPDISCERCPKLGSCLILDRAGDEARARREGT